MGSKSRCTGSAIGKIEDIVQELRSAITEGELAPGDQLPVREALRERFQAGPVTIQRAFDTLLDEGFVTARRGVGTQVVDHPPHQYHFGLVFPDSPFQRVTHWNRFSEALKMAADRINESDDPRRLKFYYDVTGHVDQEDFVRLGSDVAHRRLAGVIFARSPHPLAKADLIHQQQVPMVAIYSGDGLGQVRALRLTQEGTFRAIAEHLQSLGCRRAAMVGINSRHHDIEERARRHLRDCGVDLPSHWCIRCGLQLPETAHDVTRLLFSLPAGDRPEALIVADDNFIEPALAGTSEAGCRVPADVRVVSIWNFPQPASDAAAFHRVGPDATTVLAVGLEMCQGMRENPSDRSPVLLDPCRQIDPSPQA